MADPYGGHNHRKGAAKCPACSKHDHSDKQPFAYDKDDQPIPAWWFNCPECGDADSQIHVHLWAKEGLEWMRSNPSFRGARYQDPAR